MLKENPLNYNPSRVFKNLKYLKGLLPKFTEIFDHPVLTFFQGKILTLNYADSKLMKYVLLCCRTMKKFDDGALPIKKYVFTYVNASMHYFFLPLSRLFHTAEAVFLMKWPKTLS